MTARGIYDPKLVAIGEYLTNKRTSLGRHYGGREQFIEMRSDELFAGTPWISPRHLASIELGTNWISVEKLIFHAQALESDPVELFEAILGIYRNS